MRTGRAFSHKSGLGPRNIRFKHAVTAAFLNMSLNMCEQYQDIALALLNTASPSVLIDARTKLCFFSQRRGFD